MAGKERNTAGEPAERKEEFGAAGDSAAKPAQLRRASPVSSPVASVQSAKVISMPRKIQSQSGGAGVGSDATNETPIAQASSPAITRQRAVIADQIGRQLRGMYDDLLSQSVPDRFVDLISKLEQGTFSPDQSGSKTADGKDTK